VSAFYEECLEIYEMVGQPAAHFFQDIILLGKILSILERRSKHGKKLFPVLGLNRDKTVSAGIFIRLRT
jgi:hypothetical protein